MLLFFSDFFLSFFFFFSDKRFQVSLDYSLGFFFSGHYYTAGWKKKKKKFACIYICNHLSYDALYLYNFLVNKIYKYIQSHSIFTMSLSTNIEMRKL